MVAGQTDGEAEVQTGFRIEIDLRWERIYFKKKEMGKEADEAQGSAIRIFCGRDL